MGPTKFEKAPSHCELQIISFLLHKLDHTYLQCFEKLDSPYQVAASNTSIALFYILLKVLFKFFFFTPWRPGYCLNLAQARPSPTLVYILFFFLFEFLLLNSVSISILQTATNHFDIFTSCACNHAKCCLIQLVVGDPHHLITPIELRRECCRFDLL